MADDENDRSPDGDDPGMGVSSARAASDTDDLNTAVSDLTRLTTGGPLVAALTRIAALAVAAVPGAEGAGLTMLETGRPQTVVTTNEFVGRVDDIQYTLGQGPCITAANEARTVMSGSLGEDRTWPRFGPRIAHLGVHSALSLPLLLGDEVLGALNIYAHAPDVFDEHAARLGEAFAVPAAVSVHNARVIMQAQRLAEQLQAALTSRAVIDQAVGILISRQGGTAGEAFSALRTLSKHGNRKVADIAAGIVAEAATRARARRTRS